MTGSSSHRLQQLSIETQHLAPVPTWKQVHTMNIFGFMIVRNEADILAQTIESLLRHGDFKTLLIFDNDSTDGTLNVARQFKGERVVVESLNETFSDNLKFENVQRHQHLMQPGDWFAILDADEIYQESLLALVEDAERHSKNLIESRSAQFYFSTLDQDYDFDPALPAIHQRKFYLLNYGEPRAFKFLPDQIITSDMVKRRDAVFKPAERKLLIHHFQFRSADQTQTRINLRRENDKSSSNWGHINSDNWKDYVVPAAYLHKFNDEIVAGLPDHANLYKIKNNPAYTMANLIWLKKNGHLTPDQLEFFSASRWQRLMRRFL